MCLDVLTKRKPPVKPVRAYKVMIPTCDPCVFKCSYRTAYELQLGHRYFDPSEYSIHYGFDAITGEHLSYKTGFHCFTNLRDAQRVARYHDEAVIEVEATDIRAIGKQTFCKGVCGVIVARTIKMVRVIKIYGGEK